jgi:hypothetical protein
MRIDSEKAQINRLLASNGLGTLDDPGLVPQLGYLMSQAIRDHGDFRTMLNRCEPGGRRNLYESMRPYLRFEVKPLDVYLAELGEIAERKRLPIVRADGTLAPFKAPQINPPAAGDQPQAKSSDLEIAQAAIAEAVAQYHLAVVCGKCTREASFPGVTRPEALERAREAGWKYDAVSEKERCPKCAS